METESQFTQKYHQLPNHQYITVHDYVVTNVKVIMLIKQIFALNF